MWKGCTSQEKMDEGAWLNGNGNGKEKQVQRP